MKDYISVTDTAKIVRNELKKYWPHIKFSVRSKSYSGGASISVIWEDGPTTKAVENITKKFEGASFDPTIDLKEYYDSEYQGRRVHFGADYIFCNRNISHEKEKLELAKETIRMRCKVVKDSVGFECFGDEPISQLAWNMILGQDYEKHENLNEAFQRIVIERRLS